jgi:hypothetical protein
MSLFPSFMLRLVLVFFFLFFFLQFQRRNGKGGSGSRAQQNKIVAERAKDPQRKISLASSVAILVIDSSENMGPEQKR